MYQTKFDDLTDLIDEYATRYDDFLEDDYLTLLVAEAKKRIRQIWRLYLIAYQTFDQINTLRPEFESLGPSEGTDPPMVLRKWIDLTESLEMYTEAFYLIAWRLRCVIRLLPGLKKFESKGVNLVRNHLIEHPESSNQKVLWGFMISEDNGPVLARAVPISEEMLDKGLWSNANELTNQIRSILKNDIASSNVDA